MRETRHNPLALSVVLHQLAVTAVQLVLVRLSAGSAPPAAHVNCIHWAASGSIWRLSKSKLLAAMCDNNVLEEEARVHRHEEAQVTRGSSDGRQG